MKRFLAPAVTACFLGLSAQANANTAVLGATVPTHMRVAISATPSQTTVWTNVSVNGSAGPVGLVIPLPPGAFADQSSDAFFEALTTCTAPRVFPKVGLSPYCPGETGTDVLAHVTDSLAHQKSLTAENFTLADDAAAVTTWASAGGLTVDADLENSLAALPAATFLCVRFSAPAGSSVTPTLRITSNQPPFALPFSITAAGSADLRVTTWLFGAGQMGISALSSATFPNGELTWNAKTELSNYPSLRATLLQNGTQNLLESAGHTPLSQAQSTPESSVSIASFTKTYFDKAFEYGNTGTSPTPCISASNQALDSAMTMTLACPRGDIAKLSGDCTPLAPGPGEVDASVFSCGPGADDLSLALSAMTPASTWLTRRTFVIQKNTAGKDLAISSSPGPEKIPTLEASGVDIGDCFGGSGGMGGAGGEGGGSGSTGTTTTTISSPGTTTSYTLPGSGGSGAGETFETDPIYVDTSGCACGAPVDSSSTETDSSDSDSSASSGDSCGGDSSSSSSDSGSSDSGTDTASSDSAGSSGSDCGGDSSGSSSSGDDCGGDSAGTSAESCRIGTSKGGARRKTNIRWSALTLGLAMLLLPLRRRGTRKRKDRNAPHPSEKCAS